MTFHPSPARHVGPAPGAGASVVRRQQRRRAGTPRPPGAAPARPRLVEPWPAGSPASRRCGSPTCWPSSAGLPGAHPVQAAVPRGAGPRRAPSHRRAATGSTAPPTSSGSGSCCASSGTATCRSRSSASSSPRSTAARTRSRSCPGSRPGRRAGRAGAGRHTAESLAGEAHGRPAVLGPRRGRRDDAAPGGHLEPWALEVVVAAAALAEHGVEPRHLRTFRAAADRQVGVVEQIVAPLRGQRAVAAQAHAAAWRPRSGELCARLHTALVRAGVAGAARSRPDPAVLGRGVPEGLSHSRAGRSVEPWQTVSWSSRSSACGGRRAGPGGRAAARPRGRRLLPSSSGRARARPSRPARPGSSRRAR